LATYGDPARPSGVDPPTPLRRATRDGRRGRCAPAQQPSAYLAPAAARWATISRSKTERRDGEWPPLV